MAIKLFFQRLFNLELVRVSSLTSISTASKIITTFISAKVLAIFVGPAGIALLGQLINIATIFMTISTAGISNGVTKYVAESREDSQKVNNIIITSLKLSLVCSIISGVLLFLFAQNLSTDYLYDQKYALVFQIFGVTILFYSLNKLIISIINGFKNFKKYIYVNIVINFVGLLFTVFLVYFFETMGALVAYVSAQSVVFLISIYLIRKEKWLLNLNLKEWKSPFDFKILKGLGGFSFMTTVSALVGPFAFVTVRNLIVDLFSIEDAGIWESLNRISNLYLMLITASISVYFIPRIAELKQKDLLIKELIQTYKILIPFCIIISGGIYLFRNLIIKILFTSEFLPIGDLLPVQLIGDVFKIASWIFTYFMIAKRMIWSFAIMEVTFNLTYILLNCLFVGDYGLLGSTYAYATNYILYFIFAFFLIKYKYFNAKTAI